SIICLTRVTRIFQKNVFTKATPAARAGCRAGLLVAPDAARLRRDLGGRPPRRARPTRGRGERAPAPFSWFRLVFYNQQRDPTARGAKARPPRGAAQSIWLYG